MSDIYVKYLISNILERAFWCLRPFQAFLLLEKGKTFATNVFFCEYDKYMLINMFNPIFAPYFGDLSLKNESRRAKIDHLIKWSIMRIFNETEPP